MEEFHMEDFSKEEQIKKLDNVTLVLGNGFDLHNKLKTSYNDFFESVKKEKYQKIQKLFWTKDDSNFFKFLNNPVYSQIQILFSPFLNYNVWDFIFALSSQSITSDKEILWADIEKEILSWLNNELPKIKTRVITKNNDTISDKVKNIRIHSFASLLIRKTASSPLTTSDDFYRYLLDELIKFETEFGEYIKKETDRVYGSNHKLAYQAINKIVPFDRISTIASFNYNSYYNDRIQDKLHHINGGIIDHPIFGIDPSLLMDTSKDDPRIIFGKTYRRLMLDASVKSMTQKKPSRNIIIYGHSLNEQDYNYFFALFDDIDLADHTKDNKIIFAYSIHDENRRIRITSTLIDNITKMFYNYSEYLGRVKDNNRLLDMLVVTKKIMLLEIPDDSKNENDELN